MSELWKWAPGFEGLYEVSNIGRVRSVARVTVAGQPLRGKLFVLQVCTNGYMAVNFRKDGKSIRCLIHRLVLQAFVGPAPEGMVCCHNNGVRTDNRVENLRWDTIANNHADKRLHGTVTAGIRNPAAKVTDEQVEEIIRLRRTGKLLRELKVQFGLSEGHISDLCQGKRRRIRGGARHAL